jgi:undecaprenyl-diphosphatase
VHPISYFQGAMLGLLQGVSELFPISSLGHSVILPKLVGWNIHQNAEYFLTFLVALHLATALVLLGFFWRDWVRIVKGLGRSLRDREIGEGDTDAKLGWLLVVGTIPAGILGLTLQDSLRNLFAKPEYASIFLALNGLLLFGAELLRRRAPVVAEDDDERIARTVGWWQAFTVGAAQAIALLPGFSRSGATMSTALVLDIDRVAATRLSFFLGIPALTGAGIYELKDALGAGVGAAPLAVGTIVSFVVAYASIAWLLKFVAKHSFNAFVLYRIVIGVLLLGLLATGTLSS